ncbi:PD-(D/E)XK nuclease family protein [Rhodoferax sp.]|uniref:PD-(D/E)XK nuclease family protein n=1 Tax=Rhodoferax sp. TaxID=50421 RepID=UPI00274EBAE7|nr:PD-(D/E)XK nuclease family protein [Rhodoferax sp.]
MTEIGKNHQNASATPGAQHAICARWLDPHSGLIAFIAREMQRCHAHAARTVVLLPFAQLMPVAHRMWAQAYPDGFAPRFETTRNWSQSLGSFGAGAADIAFDMASDALTARALLEGAGLAVHREHLSASLLEAAYQLAALAAAVAPPQRAAWARHLRPALEAGLDSPLLAQEAAVVGVALAWAASSGYLTDVLFTPLAAQQVDCLVCLQGFEPEPMSRVMATLFAGRFAATPIHEEAAPGGITLLAATDMEDEAQQAASCVIAHVQAGRWPVALVAVDRALTRRVRAMLEGGGLRLRDENGWKLSTTRAGATLLAALRACAWNASTDAVLDWLKNGVAADAQALRQLEHGLRRTAVRDWRAWQGSEEQAAVLALTKQVNAWRQSLQRARPLGLWLLGLQQLLQASGQWTALQLDRAGADVMAALHLHSGTALLGGEPAAQFLWTARALSLAEFTSWVRQVLEAASCSPQYPLQEQVVIVPMNQLLGRVFAALVVPGCDEQRLNPAAEPPGRWTQAQRLALDLPTRDSLLAAAGAAWRHALQSPLCDVLWRQSDDSGETLLPSTLVQSLQLARGAATAAPDPRGRRRIQPVAQHPPQALGDRLPISTLSASAYDDLRTCPYKFFALRQLGLREADELDTDVDKRDFGNWLHEVLRQFHEALLAQPEPTPGGRAARLDAAAQAVSDAMGLAPDEFLPFAAAWPAVRDGYLAWLHRHEQQGARFERAEIWREQGIGPVKLVGRIDRIDRQSDGLTLVLDYKTEDLSKTRQRVANPVEDTQMAFYAALLPDDELAGAYVTLGEKQGTVTVAQADIVAVRDALIEAVLHDTAQIAQGAALPALGEVPACDYCAARGLCRRDSWAEASHA